MAWTKHRDEVDDFSVDFSPWLAAGEGISTPVVKVYRRSGTAWLDVTSSFVGTPPPSITGAIVTWRALAGSAITQPGAGTYAVHHKATTNQGRTLIYIEDLKIDDRAAL